MNDTRRFASLVARAFSSMFVLSLSLLAQVATESPGPMGPAVADPDKAGPTRGHGGSFGVADQAATWIPMAAFQPRTSAGHEMAYTGIGYQNRTGGTDLLWAPLDLPNGAVVDVVRLLAIDNSAANASVILTRFGAFPDNFQDIGNVATSGTPGTTDVAFSPGITIDNSSNAYVIYLSLPIDANVSAKGVRVLWRRQISPAPGSATFGDVPTTYIYFRAIEALAASGITTGCGGGNFCPDANVTRGELGAFLARGFGLHWPF